MTLATRDREAIEELFSPSFIKTGNNTVLVGPNGVGKTIERRG